MENDFSMEISAQLHTGEHIFARSLQNLGLDIHVRKADTSVSPGVMIIKEIVPTEKITQALVNTNKVIISNLSVTVHLFENLNSAKKAFPTLRFNEERIDEDKLVRVIKIGDYDVSACKNKHVRNTDEIVAFSILSVSYLRGETTIKFVAGEEALENLSKMNGISVGVAYDNNINVESIGPLIHRLKEDLKDSFANQKQLASTFLRYVHGLVDLRGVDLSIFKDIIGKFKDYHKDDFLILFSEKMVIGIKSNESRTDIEKFASKLREEGVFLGNVEEGFFIGKVTDIEKFVSIINSKEMTEILQ